MSQPQLEVPQLQVPQLSDQQRTSIKQRFRACLRQVGNSYKKISELKMEIMKLPISLFQWFYDCHIYKKQLIALLNELQLKLQGCELFLNSEAAAFKERILDTMIYRYFINLNNITQVLLTAAASVTILCAGILGIGLPAVISYLSAGIRVTRNISLAIGVVVLTVDIGYRFYEAHKSKQNYVKAVEQVKQKLAEFDQQIESA